MAKKKLAVVVPMYNVQDFLNDSLDSLLRQDVKQDDLQIILIDDGSTDDTFKLANKYVESYPNFFEIHKFDNAGLGAARNRGTVFADAEYITYVDPDDIVVDGAYSRALSILEQTSSDILVGGTKRFNSAKVWNSFIHEKAVKVNKLKTNLQESPELIWDSTSWNKLYNLSYMRNNRFLFPEHMLYEDLPVVTPALAKADTIDVMADTMYLWRARDYGAPSITQLSSNNPLTILDRLKANTLVMNSLKELNVSEELISIQSQKFLDFDTLMMFRRDRYDLFLPEQKQLLFYKLKEYLGQFSDSQISNSSFENQVYFRKVLQIDDLVDFNNLTLSFLRNETNYYGHWIDGIWTLSSDISNLTKTACKNDLKIHTKIEKVNFDLENLNISGYLYAQYSDMSKIDYIRDAKVTLYNSEHTKINSNVGDIKFFKNNKITSKFGYNKNHFIKDGADFNYDFSGYKLTIPLKELLVDTDYLTITIELKIDNVLISTELLNPVSGCGPRPRVKISTVLSAAFEIVYDSNSWLLKISPKLNIPILKFISDTHFKGSNLGENVYIQNKSTTLQLDKLNNEFFLPVSVSERLSHYEKEARGDWQFITGNSEKTRPIYFVNNLPIHLPHDTLFKTLSSKKGQANLEISWYYPKTKQVFVKGNVLTIDFELFGWESEASIVEIVPDYSLLQIVWNTEKIGNSTYRLTLPLTLDGFGKKEWLNFRVKMTFIDGYETSQILKWGDEHFDLEDSFISSDNVSWEFRRILRNGGGFAIKRTADRIYRKEIGSFEKFLEIEYTKWLKEPLLDNTIIWSAYWGRNNKFNGNPRALYEFVAKNYPDLKNVVVVKDAIYSFEEYSPNTKVISFGTKEYWYYLAKAKYFVNDVNFTQEERKKRKGQIEIQTMHGTPLKTMGFDVLDEWKDSTYNKIHKRYKSYDYLVVSSDWVGEYAKHAFNVDPKLLKTGYPRNDIFFKKHSLEEINEIKKSLGLPLDKKIILYTPTFRIKNEEVSLTQRFEDVDKLVKSLGEDKVLVIKNHNFDKYKPIPRKYSNKIFLMSPFENINNLYIISDALITDYSSVMFDYMLLHKPMMFWAYDYDQYINNRGINFSLKNEAPGPFIQQQSELEKWINDYESIPTAFRKNIHDFIYKFGQYDVGLASKQIAEIIFGKR